MSAADSSRPASRASSVRCAVTVETSARTTGPVSAATPAEPAVVPPAAAAAGGTTAGSAGVAALTGPVVRADVSTVTAHLTELARLAGRDESAADIPASYRVLARSAALRSLAGRRIRPDQAARLLDALAEPAHGGASRPPERSPDHGGGPR